VVPDSAIFDARRRAQFGSTILGLKQLNLFAAMMEQPVLKINPRKRRRQVAQIGSGRPDQARQLSERPVCRRDSLSSPGAISISRSGLSLLASTRIARLSTILVVALSARERTPA
jgi:hypothetical protein